MIEKNLSFFQNKYKINELKKTNDEKKDIEEDILFNLGESLHRLEDDLENEDNYKNVLVDLIALANIYNIDLHALLMKHFRV